MREPARNDPRADRPRRRRISLISRKYTEGALTAAKNKVAYRADYVGQALGYSLFVFIFVNLWTAVFQGGKEIAGYTRESAIWYFIVAELAAFGGTGAFWSLADDVKTGAVAYGLGRPYSYLLFQYAQNLGNVLPGLGLLAVLGAGYGLISAGALPGNLLARFAGTSVSLLLAISASFLIQACISLTAFWFEENAAFYWIYQKFILVLGTLMPIEFLPAPLQAAARLLPTSQVAYAPARIAAMGDLGEAISLMGVQAAWIAVLGFIATAIFRLGVRRVSVQGG